MTSERFLPALNLGTLLGLPTWSAGPKGQPAEIAAALVAAGYRGVQGSDDPAYKAAGLTTYGSGRVVQPHEAHAVLAAQAAAGHHCTTLHVGTGFESNSEAFRLIEAILKASDRLGHPAHIETHRATITQDIWRTLGWVEHFPEVTFNADLSHWYTGLEMQYGDFPGKLQIMAPIFERVRFVHGRIGTSGIIQVAIGLGGRDEPHVTRFAQMWQHCFVGFLATAPADQQIVFAPEILPEAVDTPTGPLYIEYALNVPTPDGGLTEIGDRWDQARRLTDLARSAFDRALAAREPARVPAAAGML